MDVWKARGTAPKGLEAYGVTEGMSIYEKPASLKDTSFSYEKSKSIIDSILDIKYDSDGYILNNPDVDGAIFRLDQMLESNEISEEERDKIIEGNDLIRNRLMDLEKQAAWGGPRRQ
jgi:hypothetical protein